MVKGTYRRHEMVFCRRELAYEERISPRNEAEGSLLELYTAGLTWFQGSRMLSRGSLLLWSLWYANIKGTAIDRKGKLGFCWCSAVMMP